MQQRGRINRGDRSSGLRHDRDDIRTLYEHDRDRILYTTAFRRLAEVTQVVGAEEGHVFHNRLTHLLRVAQVARRIAQRLRERQPTLARRAGGVDPDLAEAASVAHDLGHPPFGHVAEKQLDYLLRDRRIKDGFEGNAQSFRIVTRLALRRADEGGLDLTRATLNAILKYPWFRDTSDPRRVNKKWRKFGAYREDADAFHWARRLGPARGIPTVEAEIMDWSDDITYAVHDLEDFTRARLIPLDRILVREDERRRCVAEILKRWIAEEGRTPYPEPFLRTRFEAVVKLLYMHPDLRQPYEGRAAQRGALRSACSALIGKYVSGASLETQGRRVRYVRSNASHGEVEMLKQLTWHYVIRRPSLASQQHGHRAVISSLFNAYHEAMADSDDRHSRLDILPFWAREELVRQEAMDPTRKDEYRARIAVDIVCSFSEQEALNMYQRMTGASLGSVLGR